ncbi:hypothetical protein [Vreelandella populi]|uniref:hypothetical protein n=1 Tax=Vreelandella populi TaxID=2498858 RepID=UPI000F8C6E34|nr:hypothetical protein [Halomonas populi]RUR54711.1 hypothetical protein ELY40_10450 [Halomonas populi]
MLKGKTMPFEADKRAMAPVVLRSRVAAKQLLSMGALNEYATFFALSKVPLKSGEKTMLAKKITVLAGGDPALQHTQLKILEKQMAAVRRYLSQQYLKCKNV